MEILALIISILSLLCVVVVTYTGRQGIHGWLIQRKRKQQRKRAIAFCAKCQEPVGKWEDYTFVKASSTVNWHPSYYLCLTCQSDRRNHFLHSNQFHSS